MVVKERGSLEWAEREKVEHDDKTLRCNFKVYSECKSRVRGCERGTWVVEEELVGLQQEKWIQQYPDPSLEPLL